MAYAEGKALLREWGLPETLRGVGAIALGYAAGPEGAAAPRKDGYVVRIQQDLVLPEASVLLGGNASRSEAVERTSALSSY